MKLAIAVFVLAAAMTFTTQITAQAPAPPPAKVGFINSDLFANRSGGITRLVNALKTLDAEFKARRDEITQLVSRFDALQQVPPGTTPAQLATRRDQAQTLQIDIQRKQEDARVAYAKRLAALTNPIRLSVFNALEAYAKQRGIDVLIDQSKFPDGILLTNPNADLTPAFIRDINSRNP